MRSQGQKYLSAYPFWVETYRSPKNCLPDGGWEIVEIEDFSYEGSDRWGHDSGFRPYTSWGFCCVCA